MVRDATVRCFPESCCRRSNRTFGAQRRTLPMIIRPRTQPTCRGQPTFKGVSHSEVELLLTELSRCDVEQRTNDCRDSELGSILDVVRRQDSSVEHDRGILGT